MKSATQEIAQERIRPFTSIAGVFSPEFKALCNRLIFLIRENGISRLTPNLNNLEEILNFAKYVHEGWKEAQNLIIDRVLKNLAAKDALKLDLKKARRTRDKSLVNKLDYEMNALMVENTVMRNMIDSIAWSMFKGEISTIRRLSVKGGHSNFCESNIREAIPELERLNVAEHQVAICCDLSTFIHVGDLLVFNYVTGQTKFIELKSGSKNMALAKLAEFAVKSECEFFESQAKAPLTVSEKTQFDRIKKQAKTGKMVMNTLNTDQGIDPNSGATVRLHTTKIELQSYAVRVVNCYEQLNPEKTWAIDTIDECLHIGVYSNKESAFVGFNSWMDIIKCTSPIYNITDCFRIPHVTPLASLGLPTNLLQKIINGDIIVIFCLNVDRFVNLANSMYPNFLSYADKKTSAQADREYMMPLKSQNRAIATMKGGHVGQGLADRILFSLHSPKNVIETFHEMLVAS